MATLDDRTVDGSFGSLTSTGVTAILFLVIGFSLEEYLKRLRNHPDEDKRRAAGDEVKDRGSEGWAMGYLYRARTYIPFKPTPDYSTTPLKWMVNAAMLPQSFFEENIGPDGTCYLRFLRGCFYWILLQACTVFPILLSINFIYSSPDIATTSIERASLTSLTSSESGESLLWIHVCCLWSITVSWYLTLLWVGYGVVRIRRNVLRTLLRGDTDSLANLSSEKSKDDEQDIGGSIDTGPEGTVLKEEDLNLQQAQVGWRYRTVLIRNIPVAMRSEEQLRLYFHHYLRGSGQSTRKNLESTPRNSISETSTPLPSTPNPLLTDRVHSTVDFDKLNSESRYNEIPSDINELPLIVNVVLARKQGELNELFIKYTDVLHRLETAHCVLASNVMDWVTRKVKDDEDFKTGISSKSTLKSWNPLHLFKSKPLPLNPEAQRFNHEQDQQLLDVLRPFIYSPLHSTTTTSPSIWVALHSLPSHLLDRFQPLYKLKRFRGQSVPSIDYYLTKLNLLASLIEDKRSRPLESEGGSSAFVTFSTSKDARRARKEMVVRPGSGNTKKKEQEGTGKGKRNWVEVLGLVRKKNLGLEMQCKVGMAPEVRDLDWNRLVYASLRSDILRGFLLNVFIWAATIFWVVPITFLVGLLSLTSTKSPSIAKYIPQLAEYLNSHKVTQSLFSNLLPAAIVALLSMLVPTLIGMLTRNGQTFITVSKLHAQVQSRYYKWIIFNIVIVFCIGVSAFTSFLDAFQTPASLLKVIADSFPKGATFFVSWSLLVVGIHHGIETSLFGIPYINHATIRKLRSPRKKEAEAIPRSFSYFYWVPNHLLVLAVSAIFAILNPLVLAFNLAYFSFALVIFKNQFAHVYWRRNYENNGRLVFRRCFRYSLDLFMVAQVVAVALFEFLRLFKLGAACIPLIIITAFYKLVGTRWFDSLMDEIDEAEIDIVCGGSGTLPDLSVPLTEKDVDLHHLPLSDALNTLSTFTTVTLPALTFRPHARLPSVPSPHTTADQIRPRSESQPAPPSPQRFNTHQRSITSAIPEQLKSGNDLVFEKIDVTTNEKLLDVPQKSKATFTPLPRSPMNLSAMAVSYKLDYHHHHHQYLNQGNSCIITPHPAIVRDDRPVTNLKYDNPAVVIPLNRSLWLPRDPLVVLDLGDTVDYKGTCLVSSEGGKGVIGSWDEFLTQDLEEEEEEAERFGLEEYEASMAVLSAVRGRPKRSDSAVTMEEVIQLKMNRSTSPSAPKIRKTFDGSERIRVAGEVASQVEAAEARSFSAPTMLRRNTNASSIESGSFFPPMMRRRGTGASSLIIDTTVVRNQSPPRASPAIITSSPDALAVIRSPFAPKAPAPRIPSFTTTAADPIIVDVLTSNDPTSIDIFSPPSSRNLSPQSNSYPSRSSTTPLSLRRSSSPPLPLYPPSQSTSNISTTTARPARSPRIASNSQLFTDESNQGSSISQIEALREELWSEHREESKKRKEKVQKRKEEEENDTSSRGWFSKYVLGEVEEAESGPGAAQDQ